MSSIIGNTDRDVIYKNFFVKPAIFLYINHAQIGFLNQPVLSNEGKASCYKKQWEPMVGFELTTDRLQIRHATHCTAPPLKL